MMTRKSTFAHSLFGKPVSTFPGYALAAATAAAISCTPLHAQTMSNTVNTMAKAAASVALNGDPLPRAKPEEVGLSSERLGEIAKRLNADIEAGRIPGAVIAIARKGKLAYYETFGFRDKAAGVAMTKDTIFNIASMTKPMVALAALQLHERGKLLIDDPLSKYFPNFASMEVAELDQKGETITGKVPARQPITLRHLMMHTSGLIYGGRGNTAVHKLYPGEQLGLRRHDDAARSSWTSLRPCRCSIIPARCGTTVSGSTCSDRWSSRFPGSRSANISRRTSSSRSA